MPLAKPSAADRIRAALPTMAIVGAITYVLVTGLAMNDSIDHDSTLTTFQVAPVRPPQPVIRPKTIASHRPNGAAAPPNRRAHSTELVAPPVIVERPVPIVVATLPGQGTQTNTGAAPFPGPGTGAGGSGNGSGSGSGGDGDGGGDGDETPPRHIRGRIKDSDYPEAAADAGIGGTVSVRYHVEIDGHVTGCQVTHGSGSALLDATTCRLIEKRFRYDPSRDADGRPVRSIVVVDHDWIMQREPPDPR